MNYKRRQNGLLAAALISGAPFISGCFTAPPSSPPRQETRQDPPPIAYRDVAELTTETIIERHRGQLERLADTTRSDDIERGGVILDIGGATQFIEIHNTIRDGPELISRYALGAYDLKDAIQGRLSSAVNARKNCQPESTAYYSLRENQFINALAHIPLLLAAERKTQTDQARIIYAELALHTTYARDNHAYERARTRGRILFHVHTHHDGTKRDAPPEEDPLRPSRQDLLISHSHEGIVTGVNFAGEHRIFYTSNGKYVLVSPDRSLALR